jgi:glycosyltransferase involved in cell wall biosynthesis
MYVAKDVSKKIGILVLCDGIYPYKTGGAEIHAFYMCNKFMELGHHVFVTSPAPTLLSKASNKNIHFVNVFLKTWPTPFVILSYILKSLIIGFKLRKQIDIVHAHSANFPMAAAFLFSLISHKPYIVACQGSDIRIASRNFLRRIFQIPFLYNAKGIFAVSNEIAELLMQKYPIQKGKILVIGNAYNDTFTQELRKTKLRTGIERATKIICVASMFPEKDHMTLLKGFMKASRSVDNVQLLLVGEGPLRVQLEKFCIQHDLHSVRFMGRLPHEDVLEHIANCDVFILTSFEEGMPTVILEALALEKPVIATAVGGIPELIKDGVNGILIPPRSPEHVAKGLERLLTDSWLRRKLGEAAAESVKDYTWSKIAEKYEIAYQEVLQRRS